MYHYSAKIERIVDGDTIDILVDCGFNIFVKERIRLIGIDTPELHEKEGTQVKQFLEGYLEDKDIKVKTFKKGSFGRWLAELYADDENINELLLKLGKARKYK